MANFYKKSSQLGRSMIEMLGVLSIIGVLSVGGIAAYSKAMAKWKLQKAVDQISMIVANMNILFANKIEEDFGDDIAIKLGIFPQEMIIDENTLVNPYGLNVGINVYADSPDLPSGPSFDLGYHIPSADVCINLLTLDWGPDLFAVYISPSVTTLTNFPVSLLDATTACRGMGSTPDYNDDVIWFSFK